MRTPLFLLVLFVALVGGGLVWLAIAEPPPAVPRGPVAELALAKPVASERPLERTIAPHPQTAASPPAAPPA
ncbi:MAG: hypothetical protein FJX67_18305, partial [Alphaproteobacteria bacterium]|nr:hypothetical protein [Alphaproteobacteria bacterium]